MSLFARLSAAFRRSGKSTRYGSIDELWYRLFAGEPSKSGIAVNWESALKVTTALACVRRIADGVASCPVKVYRRASGQTQREEARDHPLYNLLSTEPNSWQDSFQFRETITFHVALTYNAFVYKSIVGGQIAELIPIEPGSVVVKREDDLSLSYQVTAQDGSKETFPQELIWHIRGPSWNSWVGLDAVKLLRESLGLALATEQAHSTLHANGARPSGLVAVDRNLDEANLVRLSAWVKKHFSGVDNASKVMVLDGSAKFTPFTMTGVDAQHVETRKFQVEEICRGLGVLPIMVGHADKTATYASAEQMFLHHLVHTIRPWHRRFEHSMDRNLLTADDRANGYYIAFSDGEFLRTAAKDRAEFYKVALGGGGNPAWMTPNEARAFEELPMIEGGDRLYAPTNLGPLNADGTVAAPAAPGGTGNGSPQA